MLFSMKIYFDLNWRFLLLLLSYLFANLLTNMLFTCEEKRINKFVCQSTGWGTKDICKEFSIKKWAVSSVEGYYENLHEDVKNLRRSLTVIWCFFLFPRALPSGVWGFLLSLNHDWFACQLRRAEFLRKGSHEWPLFRMFPLSLHSIISNQMWPRRLRGAWFSHLLWHLARRQSSSVLSPGTNTG